MDSADKWAENLGQELKATHAEADRKAAAAVSEQGLIEKYAPLLFEELCSEFKKHCDAFNAKVKPERPLGFFRMNGHNFMVRPDALPEIVTGQYNYISGQITITTGRFIEHFEPTVWQSEEEKDRVRLTSARTRRTSSPAVIAREAITDAVKA